MGKLSHIVKSRPCDRCGHLIETDSKGMKRHAKTCKPALLAITSAAAVCNVVDCTVCAATVKRNQARK